MTAVNQTLLNQTYSWSYCFKFSNIGDIGGIFNNNFAWHFRSCDYSISRTDPEPLSHLKYAFWDKRELFLVSHWLLLQKDLYSYSWICLWAMTSFFCSISRVATWCLLKMITDHASLLYVYIFEKAFEKTRETSETGSTLGKLWNYRPQRT